VVSARVIDVLISNGFKGWRSYPARVFAKDGAVCPGYEGLMILGRCGPIENERSVTLSRIYPGGIFPALLGFFFDPATWDGSDLFMPQGKNSFWLATESVVAALKKLRIRNITYTLISEVQRPA
jgi:hypothetical protein